MVLNTKQECFQMRHIRNRRFMYDPKSQTLVLGKQYRQSKKVISSHAEELAAAGFTAGYDGFVRGWIGTGKQDPSGVIHFAPHILTENLALFDRAYDTLLMFAENGAAAQTCVRGFSRQWEQPMSNILPDVPEKPSVKRQLQSGRTSQAKPSVTKRSVER